MDSLDKKLEHIDQDFYWVGTDEPHASRRKQILEKYPEIKNLYGHCTNTKWKVLAVVILQITMAFWMRNASWLTIIFYSYLIGGPFNHMMMMATHELSHNLGFKKMMHNRLFGLFSNLPFAIPSSITFKRYHMEHHRYQGEDGIDVDVPTALEGRLFNSPLRKLFFVVFQPLFYAIRPMFVNPKPPTRWEFLNYATCATFNFAIYYYFSWKSLAYLLLGTWFGSSIHPVAGHFIAEHYVFIKGAETYSYYGPLNFFTFNVGYHNEHHDFPFVPGSKLPHIRSIAPEFYDSLPRHSSWSRVIWEYIWDPKISPFSRIKRKTLSSEDKKKLK